MKPAFKILYGEKRRFVKYINSEREGIQYKKNYKGRRNPLLFDIVPIKNIINPFPKLVKRNKAA